MTVTSDSRSALPGSIADPAVLRQRRAWRDLRVDAEEFLVWEAELLDEWELEVWLGLFTEDLSYLVPTTDRPNGDPDADLFLIQDDRFLLEQRVKSLLGKTAHAEWPHSRTRRLVTNVRVVAVDGDDVVVRSNFAVYRMRMGSVDCYVGRYQHHLQRGGDAGFRIARREAILDLETLRPHGKVSIIL